MASNLWSLTTTLRCPAVPDERRPALSISPYLRGKIPFNDQMHAQSAADLCTPGSELTSEHGSRPNLLTLLCLSRTRGRSHRPGERPVEFPGDVPLEAAADFPGGLSFGGAPGDVGAGAGAAAHPGQRDGVDGAVQRPVAATVEPVPDGLAAAGRDGAGAAKGGEGSFAAAAAGVGEADDGLGSADRSDAIAAGQTGSDVVDDGLQLGAVVFELPA